MQAHPLWEGPFGIQAPINFFLKTPFSLPSYLPIGAGNGGAAALRTPNSDQDSFTLGRTPSGDGVGGLEPKKILGGHTSGLGMASGVVSENFGK